jgi:hypothetical protein
LKLWKANDALAGGLIYCAGDTAASLLLGEFTLWRMLGLLLLGATLYTIEIPAYFRWLARRFDRSGWWNAVQRMLMAAAFFNPLWIARHLLFIKLFSGDFGSITLALLPIASASFVYCLPVALPVNYLIQNNMPLAWRFLASSLFSAVMVIYYALSELLFA